ncbi:ATP-dependent DNA helicase RecG [Candidatus Peregrinibacteria bacterium]|nr:ATP-dependent DNA helicase RecG [Candidatus Peregrinibacteria bacterium]
MSLSQPISTALRTTKVHLSRLQELGIHTVRDLLLFFPRAYDDKSQYTCIAELRTDEVNNVRGIISNIFHKRTKNGKYLTKALFSDETGSIEVVWFNQPYLKRVLISGKEIVLSGKAKFGFGKLSLQSPSFEETKKEQTHSGRIVPVYHQTEGITSKWLREKLQPLLEEWVSRLEDFLPEDIRKENDLMDYHKAVKEVHFPTSEENLEEAKKRLSFDELFLLQLKALQKKWHWQNVSEHEQKPMQQHTDLGNFLKNLPFELTNAQVKTLNEILTDLKQLYPMSRLVQGDVGSGKTVVAGAVMLNAIKHGYQTALMAPTEILARQHYQTLFKLFSPFGINIQFIAGSTVQSQKEQIANDLKTGTIDAVVGTHALIQENIGFKNLGLAVIDEQHRFGVKQRDILKSNGSPHLLSLSATPIPRTLAMTLYGDQDLSVIDEMPKGRQQIITRIVPEKKRMDAYHWIEEQIKSGRQAFVICPLIDESDVLEVKSAIQEFEYLQEHIFPKLKLGLLHGKMKAKEKDEIMELFKQNMINILVSTSVIEVGIDIPNATIMMIEGADRFGLSQLHQFRGRVGRGEHQSYCFLFTDKKSDEGKKRLQAMVDHSSGFKLAEIDLSLRGPGEIYGVKQSGIPDLKMASLTDSITINLAREAAKKLIDQDPQLSNYPKLKEKVKEMEEVFVND